MTLSVIIPAYNEHELLPTTLRTILSQTRKPDEIIVVDSSSTDDTPSIAKKMGARVITVEKKTIGYSRNAGLKEATGDIVVFTDADTILPPDWLHRIEKRLREPGIIGYFGGFHVFDGPPFYTFYINILQPMINVILYALFRIPMATGQNMGFYRNPALESGGFPENFKIAEDIEIARRMMTKGKIFFTQKEFVLASGRRGFERGLMVRTSKAFLLYFLFRKADTIGFPDIRKETGKKSSSMV